MSPPKVFISYSHDTPDHKQWVRALAGQLRENGVDASLDQWDLKPGQDVSLFMQKGIVDADRVILVCTDQYVDKAEAGAGGVGYERLIVTAEMLEAIDTKKFIPVIRSSTEARRIPVFLGPRLYIDFSDDARYPASLEELLRELLGAPEHQKPPLGQSPFSGEAVASGTPARSVRSTGVIVDGGQVLDSEWFEEQGVVARKGIGHLDLPAHMELRSGLHDEINKSQIELLSATRKSGIRTFGWPIGIVIENRDEDRPRPYKDGIRAEIRVDKDSMLGRPSYDYWALGSNGDYYLLQSLFEDARGEGQIFFNTRIVRVAESLMFLSNLYHNLGVPPETRLNVRVTHRGLKGRVLTSSSPNRAIVPGVSNEDESQNEIVVVLGKMRETLVDDVKRLVEPLFMLFDFQEFQDQVYEDIVRRFEEGEVT